MHDRRILEKYGCTSQRLRQIFTSQGPDADKKDASGGSSPQEAITTSGTQLVPYHGGTEAEAVAQETAGKKKPSDWEIRKKFEERIRSRVLSGVESGIENNRVLQAVDMAWDAPPIQKETVPLLLWAQGKINHKNLVSYLQQNLTTETAAKFLRKSPKSDDIEVQIPRICDISINLVRSAVTRRHAALAGLWDNLWPLLKFDARGTDEIARLRADALTQRIDIMADDYNYRHFLSQCDRDKLLYCASLVFPRCAWDKKTSVRWEKSKTPGDEGTTGKAESYTVREGVDCVNPHPSRWFWDTSAPLANVNTDNGPSFVGYWDIVRYGTLLDGDYYNRDRIIASESWSQLLERNAWYFQQYFSPCVLTFPALTSIDPSLNNNRSARVGLYSSQDSDKGVLLTQYFEKVNPKVQGIADYDNDVWIRFSVAGDGTVVGGEFMPSIPACYGAINANDNRMANASLAMEMLPYQDMASNIVTTLIEQIRRSFTQLWVFNKDLLDKQTIESIEKNAKNQEWWLDPQVLIISLSEKAELLQAGGGFRLDAVVAQINVQLNDAVGQALRALAQLLALADRLVNASPNELGQPNPREVAAREVQEISNTTQSIFAFYNEGPREQRAAFKRLLYESLVSCSDTFEAPVMYRYRRKTIEAAGFTLAAETEAKPDALLPEMTRIKGAVSDLNFTYYFDSRDGAERASNTQGAQVLQQFLVGLIQVPGVAQSLGKNRLFTMLNIIGRMAGAPDEFELQIEDGESEAMPNPEAEAQAGAPPQAMQQVMAALQQLAQKDAQLEQVLGQIMQRLGLAGAGAGGQPPPGGPQPAVPPAGGAAPTQNGARLLQNPTR
jgi:hypothetical protein